jgi:hypothetical protein
MRVLSYFPSLLHVSYQSVLALPRSLRHVTALTRLLGFLHGSDGGSEVRCSASLYA